MRLVEHENHQLLPTIAAAVLETMSALAVAFDPEGRIIYFNRNYPLIASSAV